MCTCRPRLELMTKKEEKGLNRIGQFSEKVLLLDSQSTCLQDCDLLVRHDCSIGLVVDNVETACYDIDVWEVFGVNLWRDLLPQCSFFRRSHDRVFQSFQL